MVKNVLVCVIVIIGIVISSFIYKNVFFKKQKSEFKEVEIIISENNHNKAFVTNPLEFVQALEDENIEIIEIMNDIDMGYNVFEEYKARSKYIEKHNEPLTHPILKETGVSKLKIQNKNNLIIYSSLGCKLLHVNIIINNSSNIKISNIKMEEMWEWDEITEARFEKNDWDYITIRNSENIEISNCEFSKAYDGITDIINSNSITIKNCKLNEIDLKNDIFFNKQFEELEANIENYPMYSFLRKDIGLNISKVKELTSYQYKLYLIRTDKSNQKCNNIVIHDNIFNNVKTRIPLAKNSNVYIYNIYTDSTKINYNIISKETKKEIRKKYKKFIDLNSHGIIASDNSKVIAENCIFSGIKHEYENRDEEERDKNGKIYVYNDVKDLIYLKQKLEKTVGTRKE